MPTNNKFSEYEKKLRLLAIHCGWGEDLQRILSELIEQSNINNEMYGQYVEFFNFVYRCCHSELIHVLYRLTDQNKDSLSIVNMLDKNIEKEREILRKINGIELFKKNKKIRNKLGFAHLDCKINTDSKEAERVYKENKTTLSERQIGVDLLKEALYILHERIGFTLLSPPDSSIPKEIRDIFCKLKDSKNKL